MPHNVRRKRKRTHIYPHTLPYTVHLRGESQPRKHWFVHAGGMRWRVGVGERTSRGRSRRGSRMEGRDVGKRKGKYGRKEIKARETVKKECVWGYREEERHE